MDNTYLRKFLIGAIGGFLLGFVILHPFSMLFQGMIHPTFNLDFAVISDAFNPHHLPMAFFFGLLGLVVGCTVIYLLTALSKEKEKVKMLEDFLPICAYCKKIRDDEGKESGTGDWIEIEDYIQQRTATDFTHGICQDCYDELMEEIHKS